MQAQSPFGLGTWGSPHPPPPRRDAHLMSESKISGQGPRLQGRWATAAWPSRSLPLGRAPARPAAGRPPRGPARTLRAPSQPVSRSASGPPSAHPRLRAAVALRHLPVFSVGSLCFFILRSSALAPKCLPRFARDFRRASGWFCDDSVWCAGGSALLPGAHQTPTWAWRRPQCITTCTSSPRTLLFSVLMLFALHGMLEF